MTEAVCQKIVSWPTVTVGYRLVDGVHFFTAQSRVPGLCAAHLDVKLAWRAVALQLGELLGGTWTPPETGDPVGVALIWERS